MTPGPLRRSGTSCSSWCGSLGRWRAGSAAPGSSTSFPRCWTAAAPMHGSGPSSRTAAGSRTWSTRWPPSSPRTGSLYRGRPRMAELNLEGELDAFLAGHQAEFVDFRRDLHAHPEIGYHEHRTTRRVRLRLEAAGLRPTVLPKGTGLIVDIGSGTDPVIALRADLDALPISDEKNVPYRSTVANVCHACGHDVHTTVLLGTVLFLARMAAAKALPGRARLSSQPADEGRCRPLAQLAARGTRPGRLVLGRTLG